MQQIEFANRDGEIECVLIIDGSLSDEHYTFLRKGMREIRCQEYWDSYDVERRATDLLETLGYNINPCGHIEIEF